MDSLDIQIKKYHKDNPWTVKQEVLEGYLNSAQKEESVHFGKSLLISYELENGFTVTGRSAVVNPEKFDLDIGRQVCFQDALTQLWQIEGYRMQWEMYKSKKKTEETTEASF